MNLDSETYEALGLASQYEALALSGWAERQVEYVREAVRRYAKTAKGRAAHLAAQKRYLASAKGKRTQRRYRSKPEVRARRAAEAALERVWANAAEELVRDAKAKRKAVTS